MRISPREYNSKETAFDRLFGRKTMDHEPLSLRFGRYFLFIGFMLFLVFALSDYTGQPMYKLLFWSLVLMSVGYILVLRARVQIQEGVGAGKGEKGPKPETTEHQEALQQSQRRRFRLRRPRRS